MANLTYHQVFVTSIVSGGIGGLIGAGSAYAIARLSGNQQKAIAAANRVHDLELAKRARVHTLKVDTYIEVLELIHLWMAILAQMDPSYEPTEDDPRLAIPDGSRIRLAQSKIDACGSREVVSLLDSWATDRRKYARLLEEYLVASKKEAMSELPAKIVDARNRIELSIDQLRGQIHEELTEEPAQPVTAI